MRQAARRGLLTVMATGSVLASTAGYAYADAAAVGTAADSPGVGSGNAVEAPIDVPVNLCGNTIDVVGALNPAMGNSCGNVSQHHSAPAASSTGNAHHSPGVGSGNNVQVPVDAPLNLCGDSVGVIGVGNPAFGNHCAEHGGGKVTPTPPGTVTPPQHCSCTPPPPPKDHCPPPHHGHPSPPPPQHAKPPVTPPGTPPGGRHNPPPPSTVTPPKHAATTHVAATHPVASTASSRPELAFTGADAGTMLLAPSGAAMALGGLLLYRRSRAAARG